jgi:hypothetical protein
MVNGSNQCPETRNQYPLGLLGLFGELQRFQPQKSEFAGLIMLMH